jgi:hypothetical protein
MACFYTALCVWQHDDNDEGVSRQLNAEALRGPQSSPAPQLCELFTKYQSAI